MKKKTIALVLALVLIVGAAIGGTVAYLTDKTASVTNTFTIGKVDIDLTETQRTYKMIPGNTLDKDPKVTVTAGSEDSWVFVKIEESTNLDTYISYTIATGWNELTGVPGVYYCEYTGSDAATYPVLKDSKVTVNSSVTSAQMNALTVDGAVQPTLTFTAYAIQKANFTTPEAAWAEVSKLG